MLCFSLQIIELSHTFQTPLDVFMNFFMHAINTVRQNHITAVFNIIVLQDFLLCWLPHKRTSKTNPPLLLCNHIWRLVRIFLLNHGIIFPYLRYACFSVIYWAAGGLSRCAVRSWRIKNWGKSLKMIINKPSKKLSNRVRTNGTSVTPRYGVVAKMVHSIYEDTW